jgi:ATP-dependent DNA helicase RecG
MRFYEDELVYRSTLDDINMEFVAQYSQKIGYSKTPDEYIKQRFHSQCCRSSRNECSCYYDIW